MRHHEVEETMRPDTQNKIGSWLVIGICFLAYIFFLYNVLAGAYLSLLGNHAGSFLSA